MDDKLFSEFLESIREGGAILQGKKSSSHSFETQPSDSKNLVSQQIEDEKLMIEDCFFA